MLLSANKYLHSEQQSYCKGTVKKQCYIQLQLRLQTLGLQVCLLRLMPLMYIATCSKKPSRVLKAGMGNGRDNNSTWGRKPRSPAGRGGGGGCCTHRLLHCVTVAKWDGSVDMQKDSSWDSGCWLKMSRSPSLLRLASSCVHSSELRL